jgi:lipopolysaccharide/colanic/teichoic acid biosynthesis glycosyltransferase
MVTPHRPLYQLVKRLLDVFYALLLLPLLGPVMVIVWVLVRARMGRPALFRQVRPGQYGRPFVIHKFRSMVDATDADGNQLSDRERLTSLGRLLRRSSLDELPQIWNVLKGDMSFVGPRPLLMEYIPRYSPEQRRRLDVKPGITGLAQIAGRNTLGWADRLDLDVKYVDQASLSLDHMILLRTLKKVIRADGVPPSGLDPNEKFQGTPAPAPADSKDPVVRHPEDPLQKSES